MKRREFITILGGAAVAWPFAARAQQPTMPVIGFLHARTPEDSKPQVAAFRRGLSESGYTEGQSVTVEYRWGRGQYDQLPAMAAELVRRSVALLVAGSEPAALAAKVATSTIPIVFSVGTDPVKLGLVTSFNQPGGNATGMQMFTTMLEAKRLGLLHELVPRAETLGILLNPNFTTAQNQLVDLQEAAKSIGLRLRVFRASSVAEIEAAYEAIARERIPAVMVAADVFFDTRREQLIALAARHAVPVMYQFREYAAAGGLISYGIDLPDNYRHVGVYAGRVLKGAKPADLPVMQTTKFEFVINVKTAKALGVKISDNLLSLADEVIE
jgi:putative tryptophan/tyrosine transport system substrate-binding protein